MSSVRNAMLNLVVSRRPAAAVWRWAAAAVLGAIMLASLGVGLSGAALASGHDSAAPPAEAQARAVVRIFFETINAHQFARTCELFSKRFYARNHVADRKHCALGLAAGLGMGPRIFFTILGVHTTGELTIVRVRASGAPGVIALVQEDGRLEILSVGS